MKDRERPRTRQYFFSETHQNAMADFHFVIPRENTIVNYACREENLFPSKCNQNFYQDLGRNYVLSAEYLQSLLRLRFAGNQLWHGETLPFYSDSHLPTVNLPGLISIPMILAAPAALQPITVAKPTPPSPQTATLDPSST